LWSYLTANQTQPIKYGREYREGHRISTARVESTVDQLVDCGWRRNSICAGPKAVRKCCSCALINGEPGKYTVWSPPGSSLEQAVAA
jgi:arginyl-tRNA--protein-N-Asp/Glu arginylyltransferase